MLRSSLLVLAGLLLAACGSSEAPEPLPAAFIRIDLEKSEPERLLRYYFGAYAAPEGADPFEAGLLQRQGDDYVVNLDALARRFPDARTALQDADADNRLSWDEVAAFIESTYYAARGLPATLAALQAEHPYRGDGAPWFHVELHGVMTTARRHVYVPVAALRSALAGYREHDGQLLYPVGTAIIGEHHLEGEHVETTVMRKRADGFWDFFTYGRDGRLAAATQTPPRPLQTPTQCVGCHFGAKLFDPEKSFPAKAQPGPHGPQQLYVGDRVRDPEVTAFFNEHSKRSDSVLGLYNTLFVAGLRADRRAGRLAPEDAQLLEALDL